MVHVEYRKNLFILLTMDTSFVFWHTASVSFPRVTTIFPNSPNLKFMSLVYNLVLPIAVLQRSPDKRLCTRET
jgi:hypothetical protein